MQHREEDVVHLTKDFFGNNPDVFFTRSGSIAVVFTKKGEGTKPFLGAYYTGDEWIAAQWTDNGYFIYNEDSDDQEIRAIDLIMKPQEKVAA
jgi:hypothetical protein